MLSKIKIAIGKSRFEKFWRNTSISWESFISQIQDVHRTRETVGEYANMTKTQQDTIKDIGGFVGGELIEGKRKNGYVRNRCILTLDADFASTDFVEMLEFTANYQYVIYSTHKHTADKPRYRLVIPLDRTVTAEEYEAVARRIAYELGIDMFDDTTYQPHRLMYWPSVSKDGEYVCVVGESKESLNVEQVLKTYDNWQDVREWHTSSRTLKRKERLLKKQEDPHTKKGLIGAFCRTYSISSAIEKFIPDTYINNSNDRYTYTRGSTAMGAVVYEDDKFIYSNHATDPISGELCNAFDMIRIHKFIEQDEKAKTGTPVNKLPSFIMMSELAQADEEVKKTLYNERKQSLGSDLEDLLEDIEDDSEDWYLQLEDTKNGYAQTISNCKLILDKDPIIKNKIRYNEFSKKVIIEKQTPWKKEKESRTWIDYDDAGLRHYLEKAYGINKHKSIDDAFILTVEENKYHPIKEYLNSLVWDGQARLDTMFIDYLGAEDNEYTRVVTRKTLVSAVARILIPGIKVDTMTVLVGAQGVGKSHILKLLGGEWFTDTLTTVQGKDAFEQIQGFWLIEVAELSALKRADVESIKHFISKREDAYRAAYTKRVETHKRQSIFIGTTNTHEFLKDQTGNRRFLPIDCDTKKVTKNQWTQLTTEEVGQLWAEAYEYYKKGEKVYIEDSKIEKMAVEEQEKHLEESPLTGDIKKYLDTPLPSNWNNMDVLERRCYISGDDFGEVEKGSVTRNKVCVMEIWCELLNGERKDLTRQKSNEITDILSRCEGWEKSTILVKTKLYGPQRFFIRK